jgi:VanZ family protein
MLTNAYRFKQLAVVWLVVISILFFLPGSALPNEGLFGIPHFDKYVHMGFFALLVFLWRFYFRKENRYTYLLFALACGYGLAVELIQHYLIVNRSFDLGDVVADLFGAAIGLYTWTRVYKKNRPL